MYLFVLKQRESERVRAGEGRRDRGRERERERERIPSRDWECRDLRVQSLMRGSNLRTVKS